MSPLMPLSAAWFLVAGLIAAAGTTNAQAEPSVQPRTTPPASTLAVIKVIGVGDTPHSIAVNSVDDTIYVGNQVSDTVSVINGRTAREDDTIDVGDAPAGVAVNQIDDTVYVTNQDDSTVSVINGRTATEDDTITVGGNPRGIAVDQVDDTVYVTNFADSTVSVINGRTATEDDTIAVGGNPRAIAVDQVDDTVYVGNETSRTVSVINGRTATVVGPAISLGAMLLSVAVNQDDDTVYVTRLFSADGKVSVIDGRSATIVGTPIATGSGSPYGVAVDQVDDTVYVTNEDDSTLTIINGRATTEDDTILVAGRPYAVAVDDTGANQGLVYVTTLDNNAVSVIGRVEPFLGTTQGTAGSLVTINVNVPQVDYEVDDATVESVSFGDTLITNPEALDDTDVWQVTAPAGAPGTTVAVPVTVTFRGGFTASAGSFVLTTPPLTYPPSAPLGVTAAAGDASATVTWTAPSDPGSFPITNYEVRSTPTGGTCLVTTLTCTVTRLANGTGYAFQVRALNGAGWGPWSTPSNTVTPTAPPRPSITITGSRGTGADRQTITVTGTSTGLTSTQVRTHLKSRKQADYRPGRYVDLTADGRFTWKRSTVKKTYVYFTGNGVRSNRLVIPAARP